MDKFRHTIDHRAVQPLGRLWCRRCDDPATKFLRQHDAPAGAQQPLPTGGLFASQNYAFLNCRIFQFLPVIRNPLQKFLNRRDDF